MVAAAPAQGARSLLSKAAVKAEEAPGGALEDPCGLALGPNGGLYVSDYYHHAVEVFDASGKYTGSISAGTPPEGPCGLAVDSTGALYANTWHEGVQRLRPTVQVFDSAESTGVAVDSADNVYVNDRTYVAVYQPSGGPVLFEGQPLRIGEGSLGDAYGLAVFAGKVYVPDAADQTVKVFEPATDPLNPAFVINGAQTPQGGFNSLTDAAVTVDPTNGHLLVLDNLQPGYEHPEAAVDEFSATGAFLGQLAQKVIDGGPSGMMVMGPGSTAPGRLYVTSGNSEEGRVFSFGAYEGGAGFDAPAGAGGAGGSPASAAAGSAQPQHSPALARAAQGATRTATASETIQRGSYRVAVDGQLAPKALPRSGSAPVRFSLSTKISSTEKASAPPQLRQIKIEINRHGRIDTTGLPLCDVDQIQPATNAAALEACRDSLVGEGRFSANVLISQQAPFPSNGKVYAFNGKWKGHPAILAHVYGTSPVPTSSTIPFLIGSAGKGTYGATLTASLPQVTSKWGYVTGISMDLGRRFSYRGKGRSYLSAGCPAPEGSSLAVFSLARTSLSFEGGRKMTSVLSRSCKVR
jgi:DNA-binding beta-propeller fold protein YncE